jgi:hypothetical protein
MVQGSRRTSLTRIVAWNPRLSPPALGEHAYWTYVLLWQPSPGAPDSRRQGGNGVEVVYRFYAGMDVHKNSVAVSLIRRGCLGGR